jgi:Chaperone of endosialidase
MDQSSPSQTPAHERTVPMPESAIVSMSKTTRRKPYARPRLTEHGRMPAMTLADASSATSDRNVKERFEAVGPHAVLAAVATLPIERWSYKGEPVRHLGPMAQDFAAAFGLGADDHHIFPLDAAGVALAAIQGLQALAQAQATRLAALERELTVLRSEAAALRAVLDPREAERVF